MIQRVKLGAPSHKSGLMPLEELDRAFMLLRGLDVLKVPRFRRLPVLGSFFREYSRYWPDLSFRIMMVPSFYNSECLCHVVEFSNSLCKCIGITQVGQSHNLGCA